MEKGFNDQELADIMSEIESLEKEFASDDGGAKAAPAAEQAPAPAAHEEEHVEEDDYSSPEVMGELAELSEEKAIPKPQPTPAPHRPKVVAMPAVSKAPAPSAHHAAPAALHFKVSGEMQVELSFEVNGECVSLSVTDEGLSIEMASGATFSLPLAARGARKKSA